MFSQLRGSMVSLLFSLTLVLACLVVVSASSGTEVFCGSVIKLHSVARKGHCLVTLVRVPFHRCSSSRLHDLTLFLHSYAQYWAME